MSGVWFVTCGWLRRLQQLPCSHTSSVVRQGLYRLERLVGFLCCIPNQWYRLDRSKFTFRLALHLRREVNLNAFSLIRLVKAQASILWHIEHRLVSCIRNIKWAWDLNDSCLPFVLAFRFYKTTSDACWLVQPWSDVEEECYLVDPASSHMLVSKIKPCMCKYEQIQTVKLRMAH